MDVFLCFFFVVGVDLDATTGGVDMASSIELRCDESDIDDFLIGKLLGTYKLGLYHNAYALSHKPNYDVSKALNHSTLPIFSKMQNDKVRLRNAFLKSSVALIGLITLLSLPLFFFPTQLVSLLFGKQWLPIAPILPLLALAGILQSCNNLGYNLWLTSKKYAILNLHLALSVASLVFGLFYFISSNDFYGTGQAILFSRLIPLPLLVFGVYRSLRHAT